MTHRQYLQCNNCENICSEYHRQKTVSNHDQAGAIVKAGPGPLTDTSEEGAGKPKFIKVKYLTKLH